MKIKLNDTGLVATQHRRDFFVWIEEDDEMAIPLNESAKAALIAKLEQALEEAKRL